MPRISRLTAPTTQTKKKAGQRCALAGFLSNETT